MSRALKRRLFILFLLFFASVWWMYSICFSSFKLRDKTIEKISNDNYIEDFESYPMLIRHIQAEVIPKDNDNKDADADPSVGRHIPDSAPKKHETELRVTYDKDSKYIRELKKKLQGSISSRDVKFEEDFLRAYIMSNNYNIDKAFDKIINFLNLRINHNDLFHNVTFDFTQHPAYRFITLLPRGRKDGSATILFEIAKWNPDDVPLVHLKRIMFMVYMQELRNPKTQANGVSVIYDFKDVGYQYVKFASPQNLYLLSHVSHEVMPIVFVGIHLININFLANLLITLVRPFLPPYIEKIFYVHSSMDQLLDFFPISMLPAQYGGHLTDFYAADWLRKANEQHDNYPAGGRKNIF